jgi:hypothetical protein
MCPTYPEYENPWTSRPESLAPVRTLLHALGDGCHMANSKTPPSKIALRLLAVSDSALPCHLLQV